FRDFLASYNKLSESCFSDCVHDFSSRKISSLEIGCALNCTEKYLKMTQRIMLRFQEHQQQVTESIASQK
ncbi:uncharacterized protein TRIADDRAFT_26324, partial [Trichoplax adhaerens]